VPGVDKWKEGDRKIDDMLAVPKTYFGLQVDYAEFRSERPIPQIVRKDEAWWAFFMHVVGHKKAGCFDYHAPPENCVFEFIAAMPEDDSALFGEMDDIERMLTKGPGALWRWVEENRNA
jgi:hypothetical protein